MRIPILEIAAAAALTVAAIASLASGANAGDVIVKGAFARASTTPAAKAGIVYFALTNVGSAADRLIAISTDRALRADVHESVAESGTMAMRALDSVEIAPGENLSFAPGGLHVMLWNLKSPLIEGETFKMRLTLEKSGVIEADVPVLGVAATQP